MDVVRMFNERGSCLAGIKITEDVMQGVVQMSTGAWYDPENPSQYGSMCKHGNPNMLSPDVGTSKLGQGPAAHSCLVEVELYDGPAQNITAFNPPEIIKNRKRQRQKILPYNHVEVLFSYQDLGQTCFPKPLLVELIWSVWSWKMASRQKTRLMRETKH